MSVRARPRSARVRAFAKINLDLRVLNRRPDQYHELRTIFQTISLADRIEITFTPARRTKITIDGNVAIQGNLIARAAQSCLDAMHVSASVHFQLDKRIPMGAGLGGGSSDAAAVLLALPVLADRHILLPQLMRIAADLGSDVPFFLVGGTAAAIGRGTELFPLPDLRGRQGVLVAPNVHVSTPDAYRRLSPRLTLESQQNKMVSFQSVVWTLSHVSAGTGASAAGVNDFETVVFEQCPQLKAVKQQLAKLGAQPVMMTGSGSAIFGFFSKPAQTARAIERIKKERVFPVRTLSRTGYRAAWQQGLKGHAIKNLWPPQSRYAQ